MSILGIHWDTSDLAGKTDTQSSVGGYLAGYTGILRAQLANVWEDVLGFSELRFCFFGVAPGHAELSWQVFGRMHWDSKGSVGGYLEVIHKDSQSPVGGYLRDT